jgi:hypothetical protein
MKGNVIHTKINGSGSIKMRAVLMLLTLAGAVWLICHFFYCLGKKNAIKSQNQKDEASSPRRKKVECVVIENGNRSRNNF